MVAGSSSSNSISARGCGAGARDSPEGTLRGSPGCGEIEMRIKQYLLMAALALSVPACHKQPDAAPPAANQSGIDAIAAAVANPNRFAGDAEEDSWRKPAEVLQLLDLQPGARGLDYFSAGGYFTELLSYAVGPQGKVI